MKEELGLDVRIVRKLTEHVDPYTHDGLVNFLCHPTMMGIELSSELSEARWFNLDEIRKLKEIHPGLKAFLVKGLTSDPF